MSKRSVKEKRQRRLREKRKYASSKRQSVSAASPSDEFPSNPEQDHAPTIFSPESEQGGMGGVLIDPRGCRHLRRYARDAVRILQFQTETGEDVFSRDEVMRLIRGAAPLAEKAIAAGKQREYAAVMKVLLECAKLEQADHPKEVDVNHHHDGDSGTDDRRSEIIAICRAALQRAGVDAAGNIGGNERAIEVGV